MSREGSDEYRDGVLWNGFDYERQAWVEDGKYVRCGHPASMQCGCYGREHEGEDSLAVAPERESQSSKHCDAGWMNDVRFGG